jgi:peptide/nickel transport system substrate-binding protein
MRTSRSILRASLLVGTLAAVSPALAFTQAPSLNDQVAAGTLPPVDKRLPEKPFVQKVVGKIGVYGGNFRGFALGDADKWSLYKTGLSGGLVARGFREMKTISKNGMDGWSPAIAETWTWDDGATGLTIHLRKGVKWSDGAPLTADDIVWTWNNVQMNKGYQPSVPAQFVVAGKPMEVTKVDDVTVHFKFAGPYPWFLAALYSGSLQPFGQILAPKHYLEKFSPESNPQSTWKDFQKVYTLANPDLPTASPWMLKKYDSATEAVLVRNPYYWAVDAEGHQLPYIDTMTFAMLGSQEAAVLRGMSGQIDLGERNFQVLQNLPLLKKSEDKGAYKIALTTGDNFTNGNEIWFNYALADRASPLRDLLRTATFRNALSLAIDRNAINQSLYLGLAKPAAIGLSTKSPYWSEEMAKIAKINAQFDVKKAGALLDQLGLKDTNGDGIREYPDGKGNVTVVLGAASEINAHVNFAEMVVNYWRKVGLDARVGVQTRQALFTGVTDASFNAVVWGTTSVVYPEFRTTEGVITASYQVGPSQVKDPPEDLKQLWDLAGQIMVSTDSKKTQALVEQSQRLRAEKTLGVFSANDVPLVIIVSNRLKNVPAATDVVIDDQDHLPLMPDQWYLQP